MWRLLNVCRSHHHQNHKHTSVTMETLTANENVMKENVSPSPSPTKTAEKRKACDDTTTQQVAPVVKRTRLESTEVLTTVCTAPVIWAADAGVDGKAIYVDDDRCIVGTLDGQVMFLDHTGTLLSQQQLRPQVSAILKDGDFLYAWCHAKNRFIKEKGALYDITGDTPLLVYEVEGFGELVTHAAMVDGCLILGDDKGSLAMVKPDGQFAWKVQQSDPGSGGFMGADTTGVYFAHKKSVSKYGLASGERVWNRDVTSATHVAIQNGAMDEDFVYVDFNGKILQLDKKTGSPAKEFSPLRHRASGLCVGNGLLITASCPTVVFDTKQGKELFRMNFAGRLEDSVSMLQKDGLLFTCWDKIYCIDLSRKAIKRAVDGRSTRTKSIDIPAPESFLEREIVLEKRRLRIDDISHAVIEIKKIDGEITARCTSGKYHASWPILFPLPLQHVGHKFVVDKLVPSELGSFYRVQGPISVYEEGEPDDESNEGKTDTEEVEQKDGEKEAEKEKETAPQPDTDTTPK